MTDAEEPLYYIQNRDAVCGNCAVWWRVDGKGYTTDLNFAWKVPKSKAEKICSYRPDQDTPRLAEVVDGLAEAHVNRGLLF